MTSALSSPFCRRPTPCDLSPCIEFLVRPPPLARAYLGLETQRQWNGLASARTTPALLGLSSIITL